MSIRNNPMNFIPKYITSGFLWFRTPQQGWRKLFCFLHRSSVFCSLRRRSKVSVMPPITVYFSDLDRAYWKHGRFSAYSRSDVSITLYSSDHRMSPCPCLLLKFWEKLGCILLCTRHSALYSLNANLRFDRAMWLLYSWQNYPNYCSFTMKPNNYLTIVQ